MPFQPHGIPKDRQRGMVPERAQQKALLEATGLLLPLATGALGRGSALPTTSVTTHPGCTMRMSTTPSFGKCRVHTRNKEDPTTGWPEKLTDKPVTKTPVTPRQTPRMALPQVPRGGKDTEKSIQMLPCLPACLSHAKGAPPPNDDMAPWTGASQSSEASFHTLFAPVVSILHSVPCSSDGPPGFSGFFPDLGGKATSAEGEQRQRARQGSRAKQKGRSRCLPRHFKNRRQGVKLPPVPSITILNFSCNFTFSFFELPPYQSRQHWVQCQQLLRLFTEQLQ